MDSGPLTSVASVFYFCFTTYFRLNVDWWRPSSHAQHWKLEVRGMKACFSPQETMKAKEAAGHTKN